MAVDARPTHPNTARLLEQLATELERVAGETGRCGDRCGAFVCSRVRGHDDDHTWWSPDDGASRSWRLDEPVRLALFLSPVWDPENADDVASAARAVRMFQERETRA